MVELDNVDRGILHELQVDARNRTAQEIADKVDVSASTVRNRIEELEADGIIEGYHPKIDYEAADLPLQILFVCSAPRGNGRRWSSRYSTCVESWTCGKH
jgi:DNA-binding Lrp family transcriptional regulator